MKVCFIQVAPFLLKSGKFNPLYDPIINVCRKNRIDWEVWVLDKDAIVGYESEHVRLIWRYSKFAFWCYCVLHHVFGFSVWNAYAFVGRIYRWMRLLPADADVFITNAHVWCDVLSGISPRARIVELQHGILYPDHIGYFHRDGLLKKDFRLYRNLMFWVYGDGFRKVYDKNEGNHRMLVNRVHVIGDVQRAERSFKDEEKPRNVIVIAGQMVRGAEFTYKDILLMKRAYEGSMRKVFSELEKKGNPDGWRVIFRHHPRFGGCADLSDWGKEFPSLIIDNEEPWSALLPRVKCLLTINSTVAFDAAAFGVPTVVIRFKEIRDILCEEFEYPLPFLTIEKCLCEGTRYNKYQDEVRAWHSKFYAPYDDMKCLDLLRSAGEKECE